jgi:6-phosphofructokinase 1
VRTLGYGAVDFLLNTTPGGPTGALVCVVEGKLQYLEFSQLLDAKSGKSRVRRVNVASPSYKIAREYMIRLEREDLEDAEKLRLLAAAASGPAHLCSPEELRARFENSLRS